MKFSGRSGFSGGYEILSTIRRAALSYLTRKESLAHPGAELANPRSFAGGQREVEECFKIFDPQHRQVQAEFALDVFRVGR